MVATIKRRRFLNLQIHDETSPSSTSSVEVAAPPKKLKVPTRRRRRTESLAKIYKETATGNKFNLKPQVLNHLGIADSSNSNKRKVKVAPAQKKEVSTISTTLSEIPKRLYDLIQDAARARKSLKLNNNRSAKRELEDIESAILRATGHFKYITEELPSDWIYDPKTSFMNHVPKGPTPPKPKTKKKKTTTKKMIKITWSSPNYHGSYPMNNAEHNIWNDFKNKDTAEARTNMPVRVEEYLNTVGKDDKVVDLLGKFAVDTFNRSCQMYVNNDEDNQISRAEFMECKFYKLTSKYIFYMIIEAIEQGIPGVYETRVECGAKDGAKRLMIFRLTAREPKWNRPWIKPRREPEVEYETVQGGSSDPQDFYLLTGMVRRVKTEGGGFDYFNPPFACHTINFTSTKDEGAKAFVPNVTNPLQFPVATQTIPMDC